MLRRLFVRRLLSAQAASGSGSVTTQTAKKIAVTNDLPAAPNRPQKWSESQALRSETMRGPRFEQIDMSLQVCIMQLIGYLDDYL
jgi:hypothetical protein